MPALSVLLSEDLQQFVEDAVNRGEFHSPSELISVAVEHLRTEESVRNAKLAHLRREVALGLAQADAGDFVEFDARQILEEGRARRAARESVL